MATAKKPIFLTNPLFLEFCLWFLHTSDEIFSFLKEVSLVTHIVKLTDRKYLHLENLFTEFPALDFRTERNQMVLDLLKDVLSRCSEIESLALARTSRFDELLSALNPRLCLRNKSLKLQLSDRVHCEGFVNPWQWSPETGIIIQIRGYMGFNTSSMFHSAVRYCKRAESEPYVYIELHELHGSSQFELSTLIQDGISGLHVEKCRLSTGQHVVYNRDFPFCPSLRHFSVGNFKNADDVLRALRIGIQYGHLPNLKYLDFSGCSFESGGFLRYLFPSGSPALEHLGLSDVLLNDSDFQFITQFRTLHSLILSARSCTGGREVVQALFTSPWTSLAKIGLLDIDSAGLASFVRAVNENKLPNFVDLSLRKYYLRENVTFVELQTKKLPHLRKLTLGGFINSREQLEDVARKVLLWKLECLSIEESRCQEGNLSVLFRHRLLRLEELRLLDYNLNTDDIDSLTKAIKRGRLPHLKHLGLSGDNKGIWQSHETLNETFRGVMVSFLRK